MTYYRLSRIVALIGCALVNLFIGACIAGIVYVLYLAATVQVPAW